MRSQIEKGIAVTLALTVIGVTHGDSAIESDFREVPRDARVEAAPIYSVPDLLHCPAMLPLQNIGQVALQCAEFDNNLDVAIVDFTNNQSQIEKVAKNVESYVLSVPDNPFKINVDVIPASKNSKVALTRQKEDCLSGDDQSQMASVVASKLMPQLVNYERIIANTDRESCDKDFDGLAYFDKPRYTEVLAVESELSSAAVGNQSELKRRTFTTLHELYHTLGLGHSGYWSGKDGMLDSYLNVNHSDDLAVSINIQKLLASGSYEEYGQGFDVMGSRSPVSPLEYTGFNVMQRERLHWAQIELSDSPSVSHDLSDGPITFTSHPGEFVTYTFKQPLELPSSKHVHNTQFEMDSLAMVPIGVNDIKGNEGLGAELYAFNSQGPLTLVDLGGVYNINEELPSRSVSIVNGKEVVTIQASDKAVTLSSALLTNAK